MMFEYNYIRIEIMYFNYSIGWHKSIFDKNNNEIYWEDTVKGYWFKYEYDKNNNEVYNENQNGCWTKREYDCNGNKIYWEDSSGFICDYRNVFK